MVAERDGTCSLDLQWQDVQITDRAVLSPPAKSGTLHVTSTDRNSKEWITQLIGDLDQTVIEKCKQNVPLN